MLSSFKHIRHLLLTCILLCVPTHLLAEAHYFYPGTAIIGEVRHDNNAFTRVRSKRAAASLGRNGYISKMIGISTNDFLVSLPSRSAAMAIAQNPRVARRFRNSLNPCEDRRIRRILKSCEAACSCSPNWQIKSEQIPNDPFFAEDANYYSWGLNQSNGIDIDAPEAWEISTGSTSVLVGIVDSGIDYNHPDLAANIWTNPDEIPGNGIDDDGNGVVDDIHGINTGGTGHPSDPIDNYDGHGTMCSGIVGAVGNNGVGISGVNWNIKLVGLKTDSGVLSTIEALNYFTRLKTVKGIDARVTNNSYGSDIFVQAEFNSVDDARKAGIGFIAAAGNSGRSNDVTPHYPSSYGLANVLAVTAIERDGSLPDFSNYGTGSVQIAAPGTNILSTTIINNPFCSGNSVYCRGYGTSFAAPFATGVFALVASVYPYLAPDQIITASENGATTLPSLNDKVQGARFLNARGALMQAALLPPPTATPLPTPIITPIVEGPSLESATLLNYNARKRTYEKASLQVPGLFRVVINGTGSGQILLNLKLKGVNCSRTFDYSSKLTLQGTLPKKGAFAGLKSISAYASVVGSTQGDVIATSRLRAANSLPVKGNATQYCTRVIAALKILQ